MIRQSWAGNEIGCTIRSNDRMSHTTPKRRLCSKVATSATAPCVLEKPSSVKRTRSTWPSPRPGATWRSPRCGRRRPQRRGTEASAREAPAVAASQVTPRRFSDESLARLAEMRSPVACECLRHMAEIVAQLAGFERYSQDFDVRQVAPTEWPCGSGMA